MKQQIEQLKTTLDEQGEYCCCLLLLFVDLHIFGAALQHDDYRTAIESSHATVKNLKISKFVNHSLLCSISNSLKNDWQLTSHFACNETNEKLAIVF